MTIPVVHQQDLTPTLGEYRALRACVPACFYMLARAHGYLGGLGFDDFSDSLDWEHSRTPEQGWLRSLLSAELRRRYDLPVVSWRLDGSDDPSKMLSTGYLGSPRELLWYESYANNWPIQVIVAVGTPVIVTVKPGFGANQFAHAVILASLNDDTFEVIDPDSRNDKRFYSLQDVSEGLAIDGAASVILPR